MPPTRVIIDTDPGIDDALALILAFASPELSVEAITTVAGNVPVAQAARNACLLLEVADPHPRPPVAKGAAHPLIRPLRTAEDYHGEDGLGELSRFKTGEGMPRYPEPQQLLATQPAPALIAELISAAPGEMALICLGPLTNLAMAIQATPTQMAKVKEIIIMGGAIQAPGNVTPGAEFNLHTDPEAARLVFTSGLPITLVPLDVTQRIMLRTELIDAVVRHIDSRVTQFVRDTTERLFGVEQGRAGCAAIPLHDPLAVGVAIDPSLVTRRPLHVEVETGNGPSRGMTIADRRQIKEEWKQTPNLQVCMEVDAGRFMALFLERICRPLA
ncbi:nucleoside hydrolase [Candidatus Methylomirabilis sp.]|uniref:nucleoside hydrolase n=1 Tax=Candidatus Methylomirabilis sp. TaxID=2032687 RepID=UPI002A6628DC|nr:nucleoside hydrolase [Candidatus Methylomirabilis sp.]